MRPGDAACFEMSSFEDGVGARAGRLLYTGALLWQSGMAHLRQIALISRVVTPLALAGERLWGQLMLALYRSGRQAEGLATYRRAHAALVAELAIEPGSALKQACSGYPNRYMTPGAVYYTRSS